MTSRILTRSAGVLAARSKGMQAALQTWLRRVARLAAREALTEIPRVAKAMDWSDPVDENGALIDDYVRLLVRYGLRLVADSANDAAGEIIIRPAMITEAMDNKDVRIKWFQEYLTGIKRRANETLYTTREDVREAVRSLVTGASREYPRPSTGEIARRIRNTLYSGPEEGRVYTFSSERAALIARTELGQAQAFGEYQGLVETSDDNDEIEWLSFTRGGRSHDKVNGKRITIGDMKSNDPSRWFEIPDTIEPSGRVIKGARFPYPKWPDGPIGHTANCRCGKRKWDHRVLRKPSAKPEPAAPRVVERHIPVR